MKTTPHKIRILKVCGLFAIIASALALSSCHRVSYQHGHPRGAFHGAANHHSHHGGGHYGGHRGHRSESYGGDYCPY